MNPMHRMLSPLARRIRLTAARAIVNLIADAAGLQKVQVGLLEGETRDTVRMQNYGLTSNPHAGAEGVFLSLNGSRDQGVVIVVDDRRYRLSALKPGEVALYDDLGHKVHLTRDGIVIDGKDHPLTIENVTTLTAKASVKTRYETPLFEVTGEIKDNCDSGGHAMSEMREVYDGHDHDENDSGGPTNEPNQKMG